MINFQDIDHNWTLFLDRDGVINHEKESDYIRKPAEFRLCDGVTDAMARFAEKFGLIIVVTNQRGIARGLMTEADLADVHALMESLIESAGGRIDKIYHCPDMDNQSPNRKPNPGMGHQAKIDYPQIDFHRALMVGNTMSDMKFGKALGMQTVFIPSNKPMPDLPDPLIDAVCDGLIGLAKAL